MPADLVPFVRPVELRGSGPFQLPPMKAAVGFGEGTWDQPLLRLQTEQGEEVWIPVAKEAVLLLRTFADAWLAMPQNPINRHP